MSDYDEIDIEYTATIYIPNTSIKKRLRKVTWVNGDWDKYKEGHYVSPLCDKLPDYAMATHFYTIEMDAFSTAIEICADDTLELKTRIRKVVKLICKPEVQS